MDQAEAYFQPLQYFVHPIRAAKRNGVQDCDVLNGFQNKMQTINNDLISSCKKTCYSIGGRHDRSATSPIVPSEHPVSITSGSHEHYKDEPQIFFRCRPQP